MAKGSSFEREICVKLSLWWSGGTDEDLFWRTAGSGARATTRAKKGKKTRSHAGDILNTDEVGAPLLKVFSFELKRGYNRATFADLIDKNNRAKIQTYEEWIRQAIRSKKQSGAKTWCIIHKRDRKEAIVLVSGIHFGEIAQGEDIPPHADISYETKKGKYGRVIVLAFDIFLKMFNPKAIKRMASKL